MTPIRTLITAATLAAAALVAACDDPIAPDAPVPGTLELRLALPTTAEGALLLDLAGPALPAADAVETAGAARVFARTTDTGLRIAAFGPIEPGTLLRFPVPDIARAREFSAVLREVAAPDHTLRPSLQGYVLTVTAGER